MSKVESQCKCIVRHPTTDAERAEITEQFNYAREMGDTTTILITMMQLGGDCPARARTLSNQ